MPASDEPFYSTLRFAASWGEKATLAACLAMLVFLNLFVLATAWASLASEPLLAAFLGGIGAITTGLSALVADEAAAAFRLLIELGCGHKERGDYPLPHHRFGAPER